MSDTATTVPSPIFAKGAEVLVDQRGAGTVAAVVRGMVPKVIGVEEGRIAEEHVPGFIYTITPAAGGRPWINIAEDDLMDPRAQLHLCDGCEQKKPGTVAVGEEVLCAACILLRAGEAQKAITKLWEAATEHWHEEGRSLSDLLFDSSVAMPGMAIKGKDLYWIGMELGLIEERE